MPEAGAADERLPSLKEMLEATRVAGEAGNQPQSEYENRFRGSSIELQRAYTHLVGLQSHYYHKRKWSWFLMSAMSFMIVFQSFLLMMVGAGIWSFAEYQWLLPVLLVQNLGQIIGLAVIVVKSLFTNLDPP